jgi:tetratricopeptide (TPR) repeat protein
LVELARAARRQGDRAASLASFMAAAAIDPAQVVLKSEAAADLRALGRFEEAKKLLQQALAQQPKHAGVLAEMGHLARSRGDRSAAWAAFAEAVAAHPAHLGLKAEAATDLRELGRFDEAEALLREALAVDPKHLPSLMGLGQIARRRGDREAALAVFAGAAAVNPGQAWLKAEAAADLRALGRLDEAEDLLRLVLAIEPRHVPSLIGIGDIARRRSDRAGAIAAYKAALTSVSDGGPTLEIVNALRELGQIETAEAKLEELLASRPDNWMALLALGSIRLEQFRLDDAAEIFHRALTAAPNEPACLLSLGRLARQRGEREQALAFFTAARSANPTHAGAALETAAELRERGCLDDARDIIEHQLAINPQDASAMVQRAALYRKEGNRKMAIEYFRAAHELQPQQAQILVEMALEQRALGYPSESENSLRRALEIFPDHQAALEQLTEHHLMAENFDEAMTLARRSMAAYRHRPGPYLRAGRAAAELGLKEEVKKILDDANEFAGPHPEIRAARADHYMRQRDWDTALGLLRDPRAQTSRHACLWTLLARLALTTGRLEQAEAILPTKPITVHDTSRVELFRGQLAEARWDLDQAAIHYRAAIQIEPDDGSAHNELARLSLKLLDLDACRFHLGRMRDITASSLKLRGQSLQLSQTHVGQLLDEFALDPEQLEALRRNRLLPPEQRIAPLKELVIANPDHTPTAIMLLVAMREARQLVRDDGSSPNGTFNHIPKRIIQYWDKPEPPSEIADLMRTWKNAHPDFDYARLNDQSAQEFLAAQGMLDVLNAYRRAREPAQRADIVRLAYLAVHGGFYVDADDRCIVPLGSFVPPNAVFATYQEDFGTLANNFLGIVPGHPVIRLALQLATKAINRGDSDFLWLSTGPGLLTRAFAQVVSRAKSEMSEHAAPTIFDLGFIAQRIGLHCPVRYKKTERHWGRTSFGRTRPPSSFNQLA